MEGMMQFHKIFFMIIGLLVPIVFIFSFAMLLSPKLRGKFMSHQIKSLKHMTDYSKQDLHDITTNMHDMAIKSKKTILDNNKDILREMATEEANIEKEGIKIKLGAVKDALFTDSNSFCKYCGKSIANDSIYCKHCGKKQ